MKFLKISILRANELIPKLILFGTISFLVFITISNLANPILDEYGFRQTQTAITSYYFVEDGFKLAYETPVVGYPWSIPFEFPIFQALVALLVKMTSIPLTEAGRFLSLVFYLLTALYVIKIIDVLGFSKNDAYLSAAILSSAPLYLFYSGTFLIESAALFFTVGYLYFLILLGLSIHNWKVKNISFLSIFLTLGLLQKLTTIFPVIIISPFILLVMLGKENIFALIKKSTFYYGLLFGFFLPVLICGCWIYFTDQTKLENVIGAALTSSQLRDWNFGVLKQRVSGSLWLEAIYMRNILSSPFGWVGALLIALGFAIANKKNKIVLLFCLALFLSPFLIFTNLHVVHKYYQYANLLFYLVALVFAIKALVGLFPSAYRSTSINILAILLIGSNYINFHDHYFIRKTNQINLGNSELLRVSEYIKTHTPKTRPIIIYGLDWSSELPFYSERRALALPWGRWDSEALHNPQKFLGNLSPSAVIICGSYGDKKIFDQIYINFSVTTKSTVDSCSIYLIN